MDFMKKELMNQRAPNNVMNELEKNKERIYKIFLLN